MTTQIFCNGILLSNGEYNTDVDYSAFDHWHSSRSLNWVIIRKDAVEKVQRITGRQPEEVVIYEYSSDGLLKHTLYADNVVFNPEDITRVFKQSYGDHDGAVVLKE